MIDDEAKTDARADLKASLRTAATAVLIACIIARGIVTHDPFPWWAEDATIMAVPSSGLFPLGSIILSTLTVLAASVVGMTSPGDLGRLIQTALLLIGAMGAAGHAALFGGGSLDNLVIGFSWIAAMSAGVAACAIRDNPRLLRMTLASLLGALAIIAAKAAVQTCLEHPATVAAFKANKEAFFAARGWTPDSAMAKSFEHRLLQPDATAWFGLSNIVATFGAAASVAGLGLLIASRRLGAVLILACGVTLLILGGSKGGYAAAILSAGVLLITRSARPPLLRALRWVPPLAVACVLLAIFARGAIGESLGERSLLFRAFYSEASLRILADSLPWGTGPDGFQAAYMLAKNPLSPEEISSPHNVLLDFACTLGLPGLAWALLWLAWVLRLGPALAETQPEPHDESAPDPKPVSTREEIRPIFLILAAATVFATILELATATPESALVRFAGLFAALAVAAAVLPLLANPSGPALAACGIVLAILGLIDMAPINPGSAGWYAMLLASCGIGAAKVPFMPVLKTTVVEAARSARVLWLATSLGALALVLWTAPAVARWQTNLREAFEAVAPVARVRADLDAAFSSPRPPDPETQQLISQGLREIGISAETAAGPELLRQLDQRRLQAAIEALPALQLASADQPAHLLTREAASRLQLQIATWLNERGDTKQALEAASNALALTNPLSTRKFVSASNLSWRATVIQAACTLRQDPPHLWVPQVTRALEAAAAADPYGIQHPARLAQLLAEHGNPTQAADWARKALRLSENTRLDPSGTRTLPPDRVKALQKIAEGTPDPIKSQPPR
jgi:hypothetical protein